MEPIIAIVGATATGKTELGIHLAQQFDGEIVGADSRQVYRYMDIGTAKPTAEERALVPHHLVDIIDPDEPFSVALYQKAAYEAIQDIQARCRLAVLVGGSGLYVWAVLEGLKLPQVPPDQQFRQAMEKRAKAEGSEPLYEELQAKDPAAASKIDPHNVRRVIRALEVIQATGIPFSRLQKRQPPPFPTLLIGLTTNREDLYRRIDDRVDQMMKQGLMEEVKSLLERGYSPSLPSMSSMGYKQVGKYLRGELGLSAAIEETKFETHRFARHQYAWFRLQDRRIYWFDISRDIEDPTKQLVDSFTANSDG